MFSSGSKIHKSMLFNSTASMQGRILLKPAKTSGKKKVPFQCFSDAAVDKCFLVRSCLSFRFPTARLPMEMATRQRAGVRAPTLPGLLAAQADQDLLLLTDLCHLCSERCLVPGFCKTKFPVQPSIEKKLLQHKSTQLFLQWLQLILLFP